MFMIEFTQGFLGNPSTELYELLAVAMVTIALGTGWTMWYQSGS